MPYNDYGLCYGMNTSMEEHQKITVYVPVDLLAKAKEATGQGVTATVREGLRMVATRKAYQKLRELRGNVAFSIDLEQLPRGPRMIAVDSSTVIAYFQGDSGRDVRLLDKALESADLALPPVVLTEVLSDPGLQSGFADLIRVIPVLEIRFGFWERAAATRARILSRRLRARLADSLITQCCIDHDVALVTRDMDFRHFADFSGLKLA